MQQHQPGSAAGRGYGAPLSTPSQQAVQQARITDYARWLARRSGGPAEGDYTALWRWSVTEPAQFWASIWDYFAVLGERGTRPALEGDQMPALTWFSVSRVSYAANSLLAAR